MDYLFLAAFIQRNAVPKIERVALNYDFAPLSAECNVYIQHYVILLSDFAVLWYFLSRICFFVPFFVRFFPHVHRMLIRKQKFVGFFFSLSWSIYIYTKYIQFGVATQSICHRTYLPVCPPGKRVSPPPSSFSLSFSRAFLSFNSEMEFSTFFL